MEILDKNYLDIMYNINIRYLCYTNKHETKHIHRYLLSSNITFRKESRVW